MDAILSPLNQTLPFYGAHESGDVISSPGDSDAVNPAPMYELVLSEKA